jgi:hypothetical protein
MHCLTTKAKQSLQQTEAAQRRHFSCQYCMPDMRLHHFLLIALVFLVACGPRERDHSEFSIGMTRSGILGTFGQPQQTQMLTKTGEPIWGPIEKFWSQVPMGARVEIWSYASHLNSKDDGGTPEQRGQTQLYFVNDSDEVTGIGFHVEGAVYEQS